MGSGICSLKDRDSDSHNSDTVVLTQRSNAKTKIVYELTQDFLPSPPTDTISNLPPSDQSNEASGRETGHTDITNLNDRNNAGNEEKYTVAINGSEATSNLPHSSKMSNSSDVKEGCEPPVPYLRSALLFATAATREDKNRHYEVALRLYEHTVENFILSLTKDEILSGRSRSIAQEKLTMYIERAEKIRLYLKNKEESEKSAEASSNSMSNEVSDTETLRNQVQGSILKERPNIKWSDVAGLEGVKETLKESIILPVKFPHLMAGKRKPWKGILLYGPRGTGKSLLAKAVATEANIHTVFSLTPVHLVSKWLGESEKLANYLFEVAREEQPSIIFIDEVDCLTTSDSSSQSESVKRMKVEFLLQMQGMNPDTDQIILLGATSSPWKLDDTLLRWFEKKIYIPLPNENARLDILKASIGNTPNSLHEDDLRTLARKTDGYSGEDISILIKDALLQPLRKVTKATHFVKVKGPSRADPNIAEDDLFAPCSADHPGAIEMPWMDIPEDKLLEPILAMEDILHCLAKSKPSVTDEDLLQIYKFTKDFSYES